MNPIIEEMLNKINKNIDEIVTGLKMMIAEYQDVYPAEAMATMYNTYDAVNDVLSNLRQHEIEDREI